MINEKRDKWKETKNIMEQDGKKTFSSSSTASSSTASFSSLTEEMDEVPILFASLEEVQRYMGKNSEEIGKEEGEDDDKEIAASLSTLCHEFRSRFLNSDLFFCEELYVSRAPGRVNLLGEHIDYNGYGVLPFAISQHILMLGGLVTNKTENKEGRKILHYNKDKKHRDKDVVDKEKDKEKGIGNGKRNGGKVNEEEEILGKMLKDEEEEEERKIRAEIEGKGSHLIQDEIRIENMEVNRYPSVVFPKCKTLSNTLLDMTKTKGEEDSGDAKSEFVIDDKSVSTTSTSGTTLLPIWIRYILCGYRGVYEYLENFFKGLTLTTASEIEVEKIETIKRRMRDIRCLRLLVSGTIPPASGLSSSSAMVVASALFFLSLFQATSFVKRSQLAQICAKCEKYIGTVGGGMDQTISTFGKKNSALKIDFDPLMITKSIPLPKDYLIVIANSLTKSEKAITAKSHFNKRVLECKLGMFMLAKYLGNDKRKKDSSSSHDYSSDFDSSNNHKYHTNWKKYQTLKELEIDIYENKDNLQMTVKDIQKYFHRHPYSLQEILQILFDLLPNDYHHHQGGHQEENHKDHQGQESSRPMEKEEMKQKGGSENNNNRSQDQLTAFAKVELLSLLPSKLKELFTEGLGEDMPSVEDFPLNIYHRLIHVLSERSRVNLFIEKTFQMSLCDKGNKNDNVSLFEEAFFPSIEYGLEPNTWLNANINNSTTIATATATATTTLTTTGYSAATTGTGANTSVTCAKDLRSMDSIREEIQHYSQSQILGLLMNMSHESCRAFYDCSCNELNQLVDLCRKSEYCLGARLTGAGWGGCCISLVAKDGIESFLEYLIENYYVSSSGFQQVLNKNEAKKHVFVSAASSAAWATRILTHP